MRLCVVKEVYWIATFFTSFFYLLIERNSGWCRIRYCYRSLMKRWKNVAIWTAMFSQRSLRYCWLHNQANPNIFGYKILIRKISSCFRCVINYIDFIEKLMTITASFHTIHYNKLVSSPSNNYFISDNTAEIGTTA